ncbi:uncharacterized protein LOC126657304 [Mercurialis annua]|uniref:uncharacterized protein LOC126657304 n=1 Tax=Mercurialis annua TaxID=3986 RepID=UPI0024ACFF1F|nr:uncharacterized protein LOC126657304 [Mercurialis annua]
MSSNHNLLHSFIISSFLLLLTLLVQILAFNDPNLHPFTCSEHLNKCNASLYHINKGLLIEQIASFYSVNVTQIAPIQNADKQDYLVTVPCSCATVNGTKAYFYDTIYTVKENDTFLSVSDRVYSGQAWEIGNENITFVTGNKVAVHLLCGCVESESQIVVTFTVQLHDTISNIATRLSSTTTGILNMNSFLNNEDVIFPDWVLFVPKEINGIPPPKTALHRLVDEDCLA